MLSPFRTKKILQKNVVKVPTIYTNCYVLCAMCELKISQKRWYKLSVSYQMLKLLCYSSINENTGSLINTDDLKNPNPVFHYF